MNSILLAFGLWRRNPDSLKRAMYVVSGYLGPGNAAPSKLSSIVLNWKRGKMISEFLEESRDIHIDIRNQPSAGYIAHIFYLKWMMRLLHLVNMSVGSALFGRLCDS